MSGSGTGSVTGCGTAWMRRANRNGIFVRGQFAAHRRQAADEDHDGGQVFVGHVAEVFVGHDRKQRASVIGDAFADGPGDGVIAPLAEAGFRIRSDIGRDEAEPAFFKQDCAGAFLGKQHRWLRFLVVFRVAPHAIA